MLTVVALLTWQAGGESPTAAKPVQCCPILVCATASPAVLRRGAEGRAAGCLYASYWNWDWDWDGLHASKQPTSGPMVRRGRT